MTTNRIASDYHYGSSEASHTNAYLRDPVIAFCKRYNAHKVLDLGCGNGAMCRDLAAAGFSVFGCDPSEEGIRIAAQTLPEVVFRTLGVYDDPQLLGADGFDAVISTEVIEHLFLPRHLPQFAFKVLRPGGRLIISTPYHGYLKNLALSIADKWDVHHTPFWDGGHVKFWSRRTLTTLLTQEGFQVTDFFGAGRFPWLWKSMIIVAMKPPSP